MGRKTLTSIWLDPDDDRPRAGEKEPPALVLLALAAMEEEEQEAAKNDARRRVSMGLAVACALIAAATLVELVLLYLALT